MTDSISTLPDQLWMVRGDEEPEEEPRREAFEAVEGNRLHCKPYGGMWTSTYTPEDEYDSDWIRWCSTEGFLAGRHTYRLSVQDDLRIVEVDGLDDLRTVAQRYQTDSEPHGQLHRVYYDFEALAEEFDAMRLTEEGQRKTRLTGSKEPDLYGWDSECTLWLRWAFEEVEYHGYYDNELPDWRTPG